MDDIAAGGAPGDEPGAAPPPSARRTRSRRTGAEPVEAAPITEQMIPGLEDAPTRGRRKVVKGAAPAEPTGLAEPTIAAQPPTKRSRRTTRAASGEAEEA